MNESSTSYTTYDLEDRFKAKQKIPENEMYDKDTAINTLAMIAGDISKEYKSINQFANLHDMSSSFLSEVFSGKKKANRDYFLVCFAELRYGFEKSRTALRHLGLTDFLVKDPRDRIIFQGIRDGHSVREINENIDEYNDGKPLEDQISYLWTKK